MRLRKGPSVLGGPWAPCPLSSTLRQALSSWTHRKHQEGDTQSPKNEVCVRCPPPSGSSRAGARDRPAGAQSTHPRMLQGWEWAKRGALWSLCLLGFHPERGHGPICPGHGPQVSLGTQVCHVPSVKVLKGPHSPQEHGGHQNSPSLEPMVRRPVGAPEASSELSHQEPGPQKSQPSPCLMTGLPAGWGPPPVSA